MRAPNRLELVVALIFTMGVLGMLGFNPFQIIVIMALAAIIRYIRSEKAGQERNQVEATNAHIQAVHERYERGDND